MEFVIQRHEHHGWTKDVEVADNAREAIRANILHSHDWLANYAGKFSIEVWVNSTFGKDHKIAETEEELLNAECVRARVIWQDETPYPIFGGCIREGEIWFGVRVRIGEKDDCPECGGTGINHYNPFNQCWACGDKDKKGRGSGKVRSGPAHAIPKQKP
jgi:hypothetical protein